MSWLVTGRTVGGTTLYPARNRLDLTVALRLWTDSNTWFSTETGKKGQILMGQLADIAVLSDDYFSVPEAAIGDITSVLTLLGSTPVHASDDFDGLAPALPPAMPDRSPVRYYGGTMPDPQGSARMATACGCGVSGHAHAAAWGEEIFRSRTARHSGGRSAVSAGHSEEDTRADPRPARCWLGADSLPSPARGHRVFDRSLDLI